MSNRIDALGQAEREELEVIISEIAGAAPTGLGPWKTRAAAIVRAHGFEVKGRQEVKDRGDAKHRGRIGVVCSKGDLCIAIEFGKDSVKRNSPIKFSQLEPKTIRLVALLTAKHEGAVPGVDRVFSATATTQFTG